MSTEPNGWELKRSIDQLRTDSKEDRARLELALNGMSSRLEAKLDNQPSRAEHDGLTKRVDDLETRADKKSERSTTIWLAIGIALVTALIGTVTSVMIALAGH